MYKRYFVKRDPKSRKEDVEWIELTGQEFYKFISSPANKERCFIDLEDYMIETTKAEYIQWRKEKDHEKYLRDQEEGWSTISLYSTDITESADGEDIIADETINVQTKAISNLDLESLRLALKKLDDESYQLMYDLYLSETRKTQRELADEYGVSQKAIWKRAKKVKNKLSLWVVKR